MYSGRRILLLPHACIRYYIWEADYLINVLRQEARRNGLGEKMGAAFLPLARDLGYSASFFNLVFVSNDVR